ncbi:MAG TPA: class I SAM-dependent methyltransferase [Anaerolineales bacterium]|nr:class I SAM-dependent methyltransferase [Anaerolineales bacterium]
MQNQSDSWSSGYAYERFMGRWSTLLARKFLEWLAISPGSRWLDVGCGTGTLTQLILKTYQPKQVVSIDSSSEFISYAKKSITHPHVRFQVGLAQSLELQPNSMDVIVSGLVLNFVPQPETAIAEMKRVTKPGGTIGIFLWDYAGGMEMLRYFWDAAIKLDVKAKALDEGIRFPLCQEGRLEKLVEETHLKQVESIPIEAITVFQDFDDYWKPFLGNVGPAPGYCMNLSSKDRHQLENKLRDTLPMDEDGSISLIARAWAVKGIA